MNIAWYLGFGWKTIVPLLILGAASYYVAEGWLYWLLYAGFALVAAYAVTRFRLYKREPWRRIHQRSAEILANLIKSGADTSKPNVNNLCRQLTEGLFPHNTQTIISDDILTEAGRKSYFRELVEAYPVVFMQNIPPEKQSEAQTSIIKDIDASEFGPDIVIAVAVENQYGRLEAARYLLALASGYVK
jgi:hypothetical protein